MKSREISSKITPMKLMSFKRVNTKYEIQIIKSSTIGIEFKIPTRNERVLLEKKIMFFSPYGSIWPHAVIQRQIAKVLSKKFLVTNVGCDSSLPNLCMIQIGKGLTLSSSEFDKKSICLNCTAKAKKAVNSLISVNYWLPKINTRFLFDAVNNLEKIYGNSYTEYVYKGVNVGRFALTELLLKFKKKSLELTANEHQYFLQELSNCISVIDAAEKIVEEVDPDYIVIYSPQVGINSCFSEIAIQKGKKVYYLAGNTAWDEIHRTARIWNYEKYGSNIPVNLDLDFEKIKMTISERLKIRKHKKILKSAKSPWVYSQASSNRSAYKFYDIPPEKKIILAAMNSYDEFYAASIRRPDLLISTDDLVFNDQISWIKALILWAKEKPNVHLIIRPHPRELPNKREGLVSEFVSEWESLLAEIPTNVSVSHPTDLFSIYDLFSDICILTTGWSSTAFEADMFGVPVVTYDHQISKLPKQLGLNGITKQKYFENLNQILKMGKPLNTGMIGAKWFTYINYRGSLYLSGRLIDRVIIRNLYEYRIFRKLISLLPDIFINWIDLRGITSPSTKRNLIKLFTNELDSIYEL